MKNIVKRITVFICLLCILLVHSNVAAYESVVRDEFRKLEEEFYGSTFYYYYHIPQIELAGNVDTEMTEGIYNLGIISYLGDKNRMLNGEVGFRNLSYSCGQKEHILSVLRLSDSSETPHKDYVAYNISVETGKEVPQSEILTVYGLSEEEFYKKAKSAMEIFYKQKYKDLYERGDWIIELEARLDFTLSDENLKNIVAYVDANGDLCATAWIGSVAGADAYQHIVNVTGDKDPTEPSFDETDKPDFIIKANSRDSETESNENIDISDNEYADNIDAPDVQIMESIDVPNNENDTQNSVNSLDLKSMILWGLGIVVFVVLISKLWE